MLRKALAAPAYAERLKGVDPAAITSRPALARLPVLRKSDLPALHKAAPPFGGLVTAPLGSFGRLSTSPGPIFEPQSAELDSWRSARALFAAGLRPGDVVLNTFSYHLTPGGFIFDSAARALGCCRHRGARDRDTLSNASAFIVGEEKRLVFNNSPARSRAELILLKRPFRLPAGIQEKIGGV